MAKYTGQGTLLWAKRLTTNDLGSGAYGVAVDSQNNIVVTGIYSWTMDFGGGTALAGHLDATGNSWGDMYVAKYSASGALSWARGYGGTGQDMAFSVAVDASGNIFLGGMINNSVTFDSITLNAGYDDIALVKISSSGSVLWAKNWGGANDDRPFSVAVDRSGDLVVSGVCSALADLGGGPISLAGMFLAKYSGADGSYRWAKTFAGGTGAGVATDPNTGNVVFTGSLGGLTDLGGGALGPGGIFLAAYNSSGVYQWAKCFNVSGFTSTDCGYGVVVDGSGNITFTGQVATSPVSFDGMKGWYGGVNTFTSSFSSSGAFRWAMRAGGSGQGMGRAIALDNAGHVMTGGTFSGTTDFGGISMTAPAGSGPAFLGCYTQ
jgi:hypothetical protein